MEPIVMYAQALFENLLPCYISVFAFQRKPIFFTSKTAWMLCVLLANKNV